MYEFSTESCHTLYCGVMQQCGTEDFANESSIPKYRYIKNTQTLGLCVNIILFLTISQQF
jgi:hypothetical protein